MVMHVVNRHTMQAMDRETCKREKITSLALMQRAGKRLYEWLEKEKYIDASQDITILAGSGNNGGDALVIAHELRMHGIECAVFLIADPKYCSNETQSVLDNVGDWHPVQSGEDVLRCTDRLRQSDLVIDGIFGIGLSKDVSGVVADVIGILNQTDATVVSVDIASGLDADSGRVRGCAVRADVTLAVQCLKQGHLLNAGLDQSGRTVPVDVGILDVPETKRMVWLQAPSRVPFMTKRKRNSHKYDYGSVLVVGGSSGMQGAPQLSARAALRSGSGLVTWASPLPSQQMRPSFLEMMTLSYDDTTDVEQLLSRYDAVVYGPGLESKAAADLKFLEAVAASHIPVVIDAGGLKLFEAFSSDKAIQNSCVITPHMGEFSRLLGIECPDIENDITAHVRKFMSNFSGVLVLKGPTTLIATHEMIFFTDIGTPGLATAGTGDVLAGVIASFLGAKASPLDAAIYGVIIHAQAGILATDMFGEDGVIAGDVIEKIPEVMRTLKRRGL